MPLSQLVPGMSITFVDLIIYVVGLMGALTLMYAVLLEEEKRQDAVFVIASASLFVYGLAHNDRVIMFAMGGMFLVAGRELVQIMRGRHHHTQKDIEKYEHPENK